MLADAIDTRCRRASKTFVHRRQVISAVAADLTAER